MIDTTGLDAKALEVGAEAVLALWKKQGLENCSSLEMAEAAIRAYLSAVRSSPTREQDEKLPCDVQLPGVKIERGCDVTTLMTAIRRRKDWPEEDTRLPWPGREQVTEAMVERVRRMAFGYEIMFEALCHIAGTSGGATSWYTNKAQEITARISPLHSLTTDSNPARPGDCKSQYRDFMRDFASALSPSATEPDFAKSIAEVIKEESANDAACGWRSCTGCHETNEGAETGFYPYSKMFGCYVGSGCGECGGLGVVWEYWSKNSLGQMQCDSLSPSPTGRETGAVAVKPLEWEPGVVDYAKPFPGMKYVACSTTPQGAWAWWLDDAPETRAVLSSEAEAKAAAQADYERRILSALTHPAPLMDEVEAVLSRLCVAYAACNGEDHPAYRAARALLTKLQEGGRCDDREAVEIPEELVAIGSRILKGPHHAK